MDKIAVVVDSGIDLPEKYKKEDVFVLPLKVIKEGVTYLDGVTITPDVIVKDLLAGCEFKTSLVAPGDVTEFLKKIRDKGYKQAILVSISSGLSGTYNAFVNGAEDVEGLQTEAIDTLSIGMGAGMHAIEAIDLIESGMKFEDVVKILRDKIAQSHVYFLVGTLDYLVKGGRIGKVTGFVGQMLNLKPVITCDFEGIYTTVATVRSHLQGVNKMIDLIVETYKDYKMINIGIANCRREEEAAYIKQEIEKRLTNINELFDAGISPALTVHTGPDLIGLTAYPK